MNRIFYILVICCQAFGVSAQSVADAGLFTYSAAGTVTASLGGNVVAWGPDAFAVFRNSAQGALADAKVIAGYAVSSWMPGWDLADRHWIHDAGGHLVQAVLLAVDDDGVAGVVASRVAHDGIEVAGDQVADLTLALIAPLGTDQNG